MTEAATNIGVPALNALSTDDLLERKDARMAALVPLLATHGVTADYPWNMMMAARETVTDDAYTLILEHLLEIESIKYTLAARLVRELQGEVES